MDDLETLFLLLAGASDKQLARIGQAIGDYRDARAPNDHTHSIEEIDEKARSMVDALASDLRTTDRALAASLFAAPMETVEELRAMLQTLEGIAGRDASIAFRYTLTAYAFRLSAEHASLKAVLSAKTPHRIVQEIS